jgi:hypothetical protein
VGKGTPKKGTRGKGGKDGKDSGKARVKKVREVFVAQPFEGLAVETELIALREFVPAASAPLRLRADLTQAAGKKVTLATVLPGAVAAMIRTDGEIFIGLQVQTRSSDVSRDLGRSLLWALAAKPGDALSIPDTLTPSVEGERLQDLVAPESELDLTVHQDFSWWLPEGADAGEAGMQLDRANSALLPTERLGKGIYWTEVGEKAHIRWVRPEPENVVLQALARLSAAGEIGLGEGSRYAGSFRAHGLLVPVWDLDPEAHAREWVPAVEALGKRLDAAITSLDTQPLNSEERRARDGLVGRQLTIR